MGHHHEPTPNENESTTTRRRRGPGRGPVDGWDGRRRGGRGRGRGDDRGFGPGGPGGPGGRRGRGGPRARRGDVRAALLALLAERPMHGYEMIGELADRTSGLWTPSPGSVYPTLQHLEEEGLVAGEEVDGKRRFALTDEGRARAEEATGPAPWERFARGAEDQALADAVQSLLPAVRQVHAIGTPAQQQQVADLLTEARRKVYEALAAE